LPAFSSAATRIKSPRVLRSSASRAVVHVLAQPAPISSQAILMNPLRPIMILALLALCPARLPAEIRAYNFTGSVMIPQAPLYGITVPLNTPVSGNFEYDTASAGIHDPGQTGNDFTLYPQTIASGLTVNFGDLVTMTASSYLVGVGNDIPQPNGADPVDLITVRFGSPALGSDPAPTAPIVVNGVNQASGLLTLSLRAPDTLWSDSSLPTAELHLADFSAPFTQGYAAPNTSSTSLIFSISSLTTVPAPEPSSVVLLALGGGVGLYWRRQQLCQSIKSVTAEPRPREECSQRYFHERLPAARRFLAD